MGGERTRTASPPSPRRESAPLPAGGRRAPVPAPGAAPRAAGKARPAQLPKGAGRTTPAASAAAARPAASPHLPPGLGNQVRCGRICAGALPSRRGGRGRLRPLRTGPGGAGNLSAAGTARGAGSHEVTKSSVPFFPHINAAEANPGSEREFSRSQGRMDPKHFINSMQKASPWKYHHCMHHSLKISYSVDTYSAYPVYSKQNNNRSCGSVAYLK
ncbi:translation initiation factor IF-2-like [Corvus cornix cornix]|uniref:translation initiation factor IF-2-like n=1 Tax=Corvus cornix cornix TaxID=932674 RepID=UPI00194E8BCF|nr:translation initiation factor IF-2-like [Corvus cornix cornix]